MYKINFYLDEKGQQPVKDYIESLKYKKDKNSRIQYNSIHRILNLLMNYGLTIGMPYIRRINSELWEMRPIRNRIFFFAYKDKEFVLLHMFVKKTNKTPKGEIDKAMTEIKNYIEGEKNEE